MYIQPFQLHLKQLHFHLNGIKKWMLPIFSIHQGMTEPTYPPPSTPSINSEILLEGQANKTTSK